MAEIWSYGSNYISCNYTLSISRSGSTITIKASGTIYGNGSSADSSHNLYAHVCYNVSPANTSGTTTYVSSYGTSLGGKLIVSKPLNKTSIPESGKSFNVSWTISNNNAVTYSNCALFLSKSSTDASDKGNTAYAFVGKKGDLNVNKLRYYTQSLSIGAGYTSCTAPTTVTASAAIVAQGNTVKISWSGASAGTNNAISKYRVFWKNGSAPTTSSYDNYTDVTTAYANITMSGTRGNNYYFKVQSIGSVSGYSSGISSAHATSKVNQLPPAPTVTPNKTTVPSAGGDVTFTLSATDPDSQTTSFYYSTSAGGTKTKISSGDSITVSATTTYYFYSYDGLEYSSSYTSKKITKNIKPTITSITTAGAGTKYTSDLLTNDSYKNFYTQAKGTLVLDKTASSITWYGRYATIPSSGSVSSWTTVNLGNNNSLEVTHDLSKNDTFKTLTNIVYQIGAKYNDGIENSDTKWGTTNFVIAPNPTINSFINQHGTSNVAYSTNNHFYNKASITATKDSSVTSVTATITNNATVSTLSDTISNYKANGYFKININNTAINTVYTLKITVNRVIGSTSKSFTITSAGFPYKSGGATFTSSDITAQSSAIKPYSASGNFVISLTNFFETLTYSSAKKNYNGNPNPSNCLSFAFVKGEKTLGFTPAYDSTTTASNLKFTYNKNFYKEELLGDGNTLGLDLEAENNIDLKITFTDVFGQTYNVTKQNYVKMDFREPFVNNNGFSVDILRNDNVVTDNIQEGDTVKFKFSWQSYNAQNAKIESYIHRSSTNTTTPSSITSWESYQNNSNYIWYINTGEVVPSDLLRTGTNTKDYVVTPLNQSNYVCFKIVTTINGQTKSYYTDSYRVTQRHTQIPSVGFSKISYNAENEQITYAHTSYDSGGGDTPGSTTDTSGGIQKLEIGIQYSTDFGSDNSDKKYITADGEASDNFVSLITRNNETDITAEQTKTTEYTQSFTDTNWSYYNIRLVFKTTINSKDKITYGEEVTIYNLAPTVSYRKNQLGVNIKPESADRLDELTDSENIKDTGAIIIQATSDKENIYIVGADNVLKIKMTNGSVDGIFIDGGTW